jgi:alpha-tubulin suppressor-like RCC1 family protein
MQRRSLVALALFSWAAACVERGEVLMPPPAVAGNPNAGSGGAAAGIGGSPASAGGMLEPAGGVPGSGGSAASGAGGEAGAPLPSVLQASEVRAGMRHTCAIYSGAVYCWGDNSDGQLGTGDGLSRTVPTRVDSTRVWRRLALGEAHTCALDDLGAIYCWGRNTRGQLGQGDRSARSRPALVELPARASAVSSDFEHTCALLSDFTQFCWGNNYEGQLGQDDPFPGQDSIDADGLSPLQVGGAEWNGIDTGQGHSCAIRLDGSLYCWGRNSEYELGTEPEGQIRRPTQVGADSDWLDVDAGQHHTCGIREDLTLWCWGQNTGSGSDDGYPLGIAGASELATPTAVESDAAWALVRTNTFHTCALERSSELYCWGRNIEGQLGLGHTASEPVPVPVGSGFSAVSVARFTTCILTTAGTVQCAGKNETGELGTGDLERSDVFIEVVAPTG